MFERISAIIVDRLEDKRIIQMETKEVCAYGLNHIKCWNDAFNWSIYAYDNRSNIVYYCIYTN